jgi:hypothetical protein
MAIQATITKKVSNPEIPFDKVMIVNKTVRTFIRPNGTMGASAMLILSRFRELPDGKCEQETAAPVIVNIPDVYTAAATDPLLAQLIQSEITNVGQYVIAKALI